jgi:hypothetical protein
VLQLQQSGFHRRRRQTRERSEESFVPVPLAGQNFRARKTMAKPLKTGKKFSVQKGGAQSSGLSISKKTSSAKAPPQPLASTKAGGWKTPPASAIGDESCYASTRAIDLFASSMSEEEASPLKHRQKHARKSPSPKSSLKSSEAAIVEGTIL